MHYEILNAVAQKLGTLFPDYFVYMGFSGEEPQTPYFRVDFLELTQKQVMGQRYFQNTGVSVKCYPKLGEEPGKQLSTIAETLMDNLEYIDLENGPLKGSGLVCKGDGGNLVFFVNYSMYVFKPGQKEPPMEKLERNVELKG